MPAIRIERVPVKTFGLGVLGFDHLQLVFLPSETSAASQASWLVIEGLREPDGSGMRLAVEGWHGGATLSDANGGAAGADLMAKIGTAEDRGSREIAQGADAVETWARFVSFATEIEFERFPYIAYALPGSPVPIVNSSSLVASLLHHAGMAIEDQLPFGLRLSPGRGTLLGTSGDDQLDLSETGFTAILAGSGRDVVSGSADAGHVDKLFGGRGDDQLRWSQGFNILHGGQPRLPYAEDGADSVNYSGVGKVRIEAGTSPLEHLRPDFIATFRNGTDHLYSIEELVWDVESDAVLLGKGIGLLREPLKLNLGGGDDFIDGGGAGFATYIDAGDGADAIIAGPSVMTLRGGPGADTFLVTAAAGELTLIDAEDADRLLVPWEFAEAYAEAGDAGDLVIRIFDHGEGGATIRVRDFACGDLGLMHDWAGSDNNGKAVYLEADPMRVLVVPSLGDQLPECDAEVPVGAGLDDMRHG